MVPEAGGDGASSSLVWEDDMGLLLPIRGGASTAESTAEEGQAAATAPGEGCTA